MEFATVGGQVRVPKTAEVLAGRIRKAIIRGELKPGSKLPAEATLIAEFAVSRPTVREGIRILESEGLISVTRGARGGAEVIGVSGEVLTRAAGIALQANGATIEHIYDVRQIIEPPAARRAAEFHSDTAPEPLRACLASAMEQVDRGIRPLALVAAFHRTLLEVSGNVALAMVGQALHDVVEKHMQIAGRPDAAPAGGVMKRTMLGLRSQERLIDLIASGDGDGAEHHWVRHMEGARRVWLEGYLGTAVIDILQ